MLTQVCSKKLSFQTPRVAHFRALNMPARRSSTRLSAASTSMAKGKSTAPPSSQVRHKRQLSSTSAMADTGGNSSTRKRTKAQPTASRSKTTPKKSQYFEDSDGALESSEPPSAEELDAASGYEEASSLSPSASPSEEEDFSESSFEGRRKEKTSKSKNMPKNGKSTGLIKATIAKGQELWREGIKAGLGPGKQVFIERPKPRGDGGVKYTDDSIHPNTIAFLADLKENNDREWFKSTYEFR